MEDMEHTIPKHKKAASAGALDLRVRRSREGLHAALLALLEQKSFDDITIREIAAKADVGYTTFFRHFPGKEALLDDLAAHEIRLLTDHASPLYDRVDPEAACLALCEHVDARRPLWRSLLAGGAAPIVRAELVRQGQEGASTRRHEHSLPPKLGVALAISGLVEILTWWLRQSQPWSAEQVAGIVYRTSIAPLLTVG